MVDSYFFVKNDNEQIVIDDNYENLTFVHFSDIFTITASNEVANYSSISDGSYGKYNYFSETYLFEDLGLVYATPNYVGIRRVDSDIGSFAWAAALSVMNEDKTKKIGFKYRIYSMDLGAQYQLVSFTPLDNRIESKEGLVLKNASGKRVFDAAYGFMQVMDSQYHLRDLYSNTVQSFPVANSGLANVDYSRMFLIARQRPYATTGGTIVVNHRQYVPRLRKENGGIFVDLGMWGKTGGSRLQQYQKVFSFMVAYVHF